MADVCVVDDSQTLIELVPQDHTDYCSADRMNFESSISKELINALNQAVLPWRVAELEVADGKSDVPPTSDFGDCRARSGAFIPQQLPRRVY